MPIKILLAVPSLNRLDRLTDMLNTVSASTRQPDRILLVNNGGQITDNHRANWSRFFNLDVYTPHTNLGVAGSVNFAWRNTPSDWFWMHCNDDTELDTHCIERMAATAEANPDAFIVPDHGEGSAFTLFFLRGGMREVIGYFDEQFFPAYMEDNDIGLRMGMLGILRVLVKDAVYTHHTSSTLEAYDERQKRKHHDQFRTNTALYIAKWGGGPDHEVFTIPYDGKRGHTAHNIHRWHEVEIL